MFKWNAFTQYTFYEFVISLGLVKVIFISGYSLEKETQDLFSKEGVIDLMQKPFRPTDLVKKINQVLSDNE